MAPWENDEKYPECGTECGASFYVPVTWTLQEVNVLGQECGSRLRGSPDLQRQLVNLDGILETHLLNSKARSEDSWGSLNRDWAA